MALPIVSVIVPNYNHEGYLIQRLDSIFDQTYQNVEVILLDDASTDGSVAILEDYKSHPKVSHLVVNQVNSGSLFKQWIKGLELAKGQYIWIAESDDYSDPDFLKFTVEAFEKHQKAGLVFTDSKVVDDSGQPLSVTSEMNTALKKLKDSGTTVIQDKSDLTHNFISNLIIWNASSVLFSKTAIDLIDFEVLKTLKNAGDLFSYLSIGLNTDIVFVHQQLNYFRTHHDNTTKRNILSGELFRDRMIVITHFVKNNTLGLESKTSLNNFLTRNFLTAVDFSYFKEVRALLKSYKSKQLISSKFYSKLKTYILLYRILGKKLPYRFRNNIKQVLNEMAVHS